MMMMTTMPLLLPRTLLLFLVGIVGTTTTTALQMGPLLSTCVDACEAGCAQIRAVQAQRGDTDTTMDFELKVAGDNRSALTAADTAAQRVIVGSLRAAWGVNLRIVGEEDDDDEETTMGEFPALRRDLFDDDIGETADIDIKDITIYVDPLDGTREVRKLEM